MTGGISGQLVDGRFELIEQLGAGGMGRVWQARDTALDRQVALKEVRPPDPVIAPEGSDHARMLRERMLREARALARLDHPHVVTMHHIVDDDPYPWLVMELVQGHSLEVRLADGPLTAAEAARIGGEVLSALRAVHEAGICHRDVKPGNVLLRGDGRAVLTDFGIASVQGSATLTVTGQLIGSPEYIAPERLRGTGDASPDEAADEAAAETPESDLWSLGMVLYECVEGRNPLRRASTLSTLVAVLDEEVPPPEQAGALEPVLRALLVREVATRPSAERLAGLLAEAASGEAEDGPGVEPGVESGVEPGTGEEPQPERESAPDRKSGPGSRPAGPDPATALASVKPAGNNRGGMHRRLKVVGGLLAAVLLTTVAYPAIVGTGKKSGNDAPSDGKLPAEHRKEPLKVGLNTAEHPPMSTRRDGRRAGVEPELARAIGERMGRSVRFVRRPSHRLGDQVGEKYDMAIGRLPDSRSWRSAYTADFVDYFRSAWAFYTKARSSIGSWRDLCGKKVGITRGTLVQKFPTALVDACGTDPKVTETDGPADAEEQLRKGRLDAVVTDYPDALSRKAQAHDPYTVGVGRETQEPFGIAVAKNDSKLTHAVRSALNDLIRNGTYEKILAKWLVDDGAVKSAKVNGGA